jgi:hypothetical protein
MCMKQWWNDSVSLKSEICPSATSSTNVPHELVWYRTRAFTARPPTVSCAWTSWLPRRTSRRAGLMTYVIPLLYHCYFIRTSYHVLRYFCITWACAIDFRPIRSVLHWMYELISHSSLLMGLEELCLVLGCQCPGFIQITEIHFC